MRSRSLPRADPSIKSYIQQSIAVLGRFNCDLRIISISIDTTIRAEADGAAEDKDEGGGGEVADGVVLGGVEVDVDGAAEVDADGGGGCGVE